MSAKYFPFVSAIMPTRGRPSFAYRAVEYFKAQKYPHKELVIVDDEEEPSFESPQIFGLKDSVRYFLLKRSRNIPEKRNIACAASFGSIIMHMDSDDWSSPERMAVQVDQLLESGKMVAGFNSMLFYQEETARLFKYHSVIREYGIGTSLMYFRSWWKMFPFLESQSIGEDNYFVSCARKQNQIICAPANDLMVARIHGGNTSVKNLEGDNFKPVDVLQLPKGFY